MSYATIYAAANDPLFQGRCQVAMWKAAQDITAEPPATLDHAGRMDWCNRVLQDRTNITPRQLAVQVLRNPSIAADPENAADADIQFQLNSIIADLLAVG